jgi:hypothetical protein
MGAPHEKVLMYDDDDHCEHGKWLDEECERCWSDADAEFDADELGLDPEDDQGPGGERA